MKKKVILVCLLLLSFINVNAKINNNYNISSNYANKYIESFKDSDKYIIKSNDSYIVPFSYENGKLSVNNLYKNGGMISLTEFKCTLLNNDSYLLSGQEYWTLSSKDSNSNYIINYNGESFRDLNNSSGLKVTEQINENAVIYGKGTRSNPWTFVPRYNVTLKNLTPSYGNVIADPDYAYKGGNAKIVLEPRPGYEYDSDTCSGVVGYSKTGNYITISNVQKDIICSFKFKPKPFSVSYDSNYGSECNPNSYNYVIGDNYNLNCSPTRNGFNFEGWYSELDGGTKLTTGTKITNYSDHAIYAHWSAKPITLSDQNFQTFYSTSQISFAITGAKGGSGLYKYTITGSNSDKFSISTNTLYVASGLGVGTYNLTVKATDEYSGATSTATFTVTIKEQTTTTRRTTTRTTTRNTTRYTTTRTTTRYTTTRTTTRYVTTRTTTRATTRTTTRATTRKTTTTRRTTTTTRRTTTKSTGIPCKCVGGKNCQGGYSCVGLACCA